jgi:hypothetical protein
VQGQLRGEYLKAAVETECAHCHRPLHLEIDSNLQYSVAESAAEPVVMAPMNAIKEGEPSIVDSF